MMMIISSSCLLHVALFVWWFNGVWFFFLLDALTWNNFVSTQNCRCLKLYSTGLDAIINPFQELVGNDHPGRGIVLCVEHPHRCCSEIIIVIFLNCAIVTPATASLNRKPPHFFATKESGSMCTDEHIFSEKLIIFIPFRQRLTLDIKTTSATATGVLVPRHLELWYFPLLKGVFSTYLSQSIIDLFDRHFLAPSGALVFIMVYNIPTAQTHFSKFVKFFRF